MREADQEAVDWLVGEFSVHDGLLGVYGCPHAYSASVTTVEGKPALLLRVEGLRRRTVETHTLRDAEGEFSVVVVLDALDNL